MNIETISILTQAVSTIILVGITGYYAWQTRRTVEVMTRSEENSCRPTIAIFLEQRKNSLNLIDLIIGNYGNGIAREVSFQISNDLELFRSGGKMSELDIIKNGLPTLVPSQVIKIPLLSLIGRIENLKQEEFLIEIEYKDYSRKNKYNDTFQLSFNSLVQSQLGTPPEYEISKNMEGIKKALETIAKKKI